MNYVSKENMADILTGIARKIGSGGSEIQDWTENTSYTVGILVIEDNKIYQCTVEHTSTSAFDNTKWQLIGYSGILDWVENTEYKVNDLVIYNDIIYQCIVANSDSTFTENHWKEIGNGGVTEWQSNKIYEVNDLVIHNSDLYLCIARHTGDATFDSSKWKNLSSSSQEINYSTEEQQIGTWINSRPLYQRTYIGTTIGDSNAHPIATLSNNLSVVEITGYATTSAGSIYPANIYFSANDYFNVYLRSTDNSITIMTSLDSRPCYITVRYTKKIQFDNPIANAKMVVLENHSDNVSVDSTGLITSVALNGIVRTDTKLNSDKIYFEYRVLERGSDGHAYIGIYSDSNVVYDGGEAGNNVAPSYNFGANNYRGWTFQVIESYISSGGFNIINSAGDNPNMNASWVGVGIEDNGTDIIIKQYSSSGTLVLSATITNSKFRLRDSYIYNQSLYPNSQSRFEYNFGKDSFKFTDIAKEYYNWE